MIRGSALHATGPGSPSARLQVSVHVRKYEKIFMSVCNTLVGRHVPSDPLHNINSKRGNINTTALVTIAQCNTLVSRCSRQLIGPADWVFVTLGPLRCD